MCNDHIDVLFSSTIEFTRDNVPVQFVIIIRPGIREVLRELSSMYNLSVYTVLPKCVSSLRMEFVNTQRKLLR